MQVNLVVVGVLEKINPKDNLEDVSICMIYLLIDKLPISHGSAKNNKMHFYLVFKL